MTKWQVLAIAAVFCACGTPPVVEPHPDSGTPVVDAGEGDAGFHDAGEVVDAGIDAGDPRLGGVAHPEDPFADRVVAFSPGPTAGYGQEFMPAVLLGPPQGSLFMTGSTDVVSLGQSGSVVLELTDIELRDGPGPDLLVFENPFTEAYLELGDVAASADGVTWHEWTCEDANADAGFPGCAGVRHVYSAPDNGVSATDPRDAGGDAFDLAAVGLDHARFVRIRDTGKNVGKYGGVSGGFDLDGIAVVNGQRTDGGGNWP